jgi:RNA polymerase sigma factor (sigma-70 family)
MNEQRAARNREVRFKEVHKTCYSAIFSFIYSKVESFEDAEDLAQEVFLRLYRKMDEVEQPKSWLYGTMRIVLLDYYNEKGISTEDIESYLDDVSIGYVNGFRDARIVINDVLKSTEIYGSELNRSVFELVAVHGFSLREAARHCGVSYRQACYAFSTTTQRVIASLRDRGISKLEDLL